MMSHFSDKEYNKDGKWYTVNPLQDCNENWYEHGLPHSHYTLQIAILLSSQAAPDLHCLMRLPQSCSSVCFKNIFDTSELLEEASNKNSKIDAGTLTPMTGQEDIFYSPV